MTALYYTVQFDYDGIHFEGRLRPEYRKNHSGVFSLHVVLNDIFFGYMHKNANRWKVNEQRPERLTEKLGSLIDNEDFHAQTAD